MAGASATPADSLPEALELLERAVSYTRNCLVAVTPECMDAPTPCTQWTTSALLRHMGDSLDAMVEVAALGRVSAPGYSRVPDDHELISSLRARACALLAAWTHREGAGLISVAEYSVDPALLACAGAVEIAVHGWDVASACGVPTPMPEELAADLLGVLPLVVDEADRPERFASSLIVEPGATASVRLLGGVGRAA